MAQSERYGYAVSRLRAMESRFIESSLIQRMLDSDDLSGALKVLGETGYVQWMADSGGEGHFDRIVEAELEYVLSEAQHFVPDMQLVDLYRLPYDFHNVKVILKSLFRKTSGEARRWDLLSSLGTVPPDDLITSIESEDYRMLPFGLASVVPACLALWDQSGTLPEIERRIDAQLFRTMMAFAREVPSKGISEWISARIDSENVRNLGRLKRTGTDLSKIRFFLHDEGHISVDHLLSIYSEPFEFWSRALAFTAVGPTLVSLSAKGSDLGFLLVEMEKMLDDYVSSAIQAYRYSTFAPENVLRYLWMKEMETKNVRILLVGKSNGADKELLRGLLRHV